MGPSTTLSAPAPSEGVDETLSLPRFHGQTLAWTDAKRVRAVGASMSSTQGIPP